MLQDSYEEALKSRNTEFVQLVEAPDPRDASSPSWMLMILVYLALLTSTSKLIRLKLCITFYLAELPINLFIPCLLPYKSPLNKFQLSKTAIQHE